MNQPRTPRTATGRRDPALLEPDGPTGPQIEVEDDEQLQADPVPGEYLLHDGDTFTLGLTMPVLLEADVRETYIKAEATSSVAADETPEYAAARVRTFLLGSVLDQIEEAEDARRRFADRQAQILSRQGIPTH